KNTLMGPDSSTFPIVMDSPFGSLDEIYRRQIAKIIPELANQLIVLVTKTQWRGEVAQEMEKRIGREYILSYNSPKADCEEDAIERGGVRYPLVKQSPNSFEYTEIVEVTYEF
ncbi:MAG: ATP-binding protein, partial [Cyanobacteriota bacterium]|nr:ATP-binding protein [Cyanobacteriota bacterium]